MTPAVARYPRFACRWTTGLALAAASLTTVPACLAQLNLPAYIAGDKYITTGSTYVPVDNWVYPALVRLQALGYLDTGYLGIRPWTRAAILHSLAETTDKLSDAPDSDGRTEALSLYLAVERELKPDAGSTPGYTHPAFQLDSVYVRALGIGGTPLRDSFHLGQTIANDYARPYQQGFNPILGFSGRGVAGRFALYVRGEYQHSPSAPGYSPALTSTFATLDMTPLADNPRQDTIPQGPLPAENNLRLMEANLSFQFAGNMFSLGKSDHWLGPASGGSIAWSNNAENIYAFQIDRTDYLQVPLLSRLTGPFRYLFFVGSLKGHTAPNSPWLHLEKISFKPTENLEFGFERGTIWGGKDHGPITVHTFLKSFFSFQNVDLAEKLSRDDPGARFGAFDFSYRLPLLRKWVTLYADSGVHDDVSPLSAPRHAGIHPGLYLAQFPHAPRLDLRVEAADTDPPTGRDFGGGYLYTEYIQRQGYTNKGFILGDVIGRESKGGQAWLTYHLSPREQVQLSFRSTKAPLDFIAGGTTQGIGSLSIVKRFHDNLELRSFLQVERWVAPIYQPGTHRDVSISAQVTWYPGQRYSTP